MLFCYFEGLPFISLEWSIVMNRVRKAALKVDTNHAALCTASSLNWNIGADLGSCSELGGKLSSFWTRKTWKKFRILLKIKGKFFEQVGLIVIFKWVALLAFLRKQFSIRFQFWNCNIFLWICSIESATPRYQQLPLPSSARKILHPPLRKGYFLEPNLDYVTLQRPSEDYPSPGLVIEI